MTIRALFRLMVGTILMASGFAGVFISLMVLLEDGQGSFLFWLLLSLLSLPVGYILIPDALRDNKKKAEKFMIWFGGAALISMYILLAYGIIFLHLPKPMYSVLLAPRPAQVFLLIFAWLFGACLLSPFICMRLSG